MEFIGLNVVAKATLPTIEDNFKEVEHSLELILKQYDVIVTEKNLSDVKKQITELNNVSKKINDYRIQKAKELAAPIREFEERCTRLQSQCLAPKNKLEAQVKFFNDKRVQLCKERLLSELQHQYDKYGIKEEFQNMTVDKWAIASNLTQKGVAKQAIIAIEAKVLKIKHFQDVIDKRILQLSSVSLEAGLSVALTLENIKHFLYVIDDTVYKNKLKIVIENELRREEAMKAKITQQSQKQEANLFNLPPKKVNIGVKKRENPSTKHNSNSKKVPYIITAIFEVEAEESQEPKLEAMLLKRYKDACFKKLPTILIKRKTLEEDGSLF